MKCAQCNKEKTKTDFIPSTGLFWPEGISNICYSCVETMVDGNDLNQIDRLCQHVNVAFLPDEWRKIWKREGKLSFRKFFGSHYEINYYKYDWQEQNERLMDIAKLGLIELEIEELKPKLLQELKIRWGDLPELDLVRLERYFNASLNDYNVTAETQRDLLRKICRISILIDQDLINSKVDKDKITNYEKLMSTALKTLEASKTEGISSVGQICDFIERNGYKPRFYEGIPRDEIDMIEQNIKEYLRDLVQGEVNLTDIYERKIKQQIKRGLTGGETHVETDDDLEDAGD